MRIAYITVKFPFGPTEAFFEPEVRSLARLVDEVVVIPIRPATKDSLYDGLGSTNVYMAERSPEIFAEALREALAHPRAVAAALAEVLFAKYALSAKLKNLALFPKALALARRLRTLRVDHVHVQWLTTPATAVMIASRLTGIPWSATAHQHDIFADNLLPQKYREAQFVRVISERNRRHLIEYGGPLAAAKTVTVHLGVDVPPQEALTPPRGTAPLRLLCAARLYLFKGHEYLLPALAMLRDAGVAFHCDLAGDGERRAMVRGMIEELGLQEHVTMRGVVPHGTLLAELHRGVYDLSVLASTEQPGEHEGIPVAMMEAMAAGIPVVSTFSGSLTELIDDSCGVLVPQKDAAAFGGALIALASDPDRRRRIGAAGRERVLAAFETGRTTRELLRLIAPLAEGAAPVRREPVAEA